MPSILQNAFNFALNLTKLSFTWERPGNATTHAIKGAKSNYNRNLSAVEETVLKGREFVFSKTDISTLALYPFKRGDRLISTDMGNLVISEINPMTGLAGEVLGFRVRADG